MNAETQINPSQLNALRDLLAQETETYALVADCMKQKKDLLVTGRYHDLPRVDQELIALGQKSTHLEAQRIDLMSSMGYSNITLNQFTGYLSPNQAKPFLDARQKLLRVVEEVRELNKHNRKLLNLSIQWVQDTVETIAKAVAPETASYNAQGKRGSSNDKPALPIQSTVIRDA
jgi:flagellar biosynthesis/type III secretory pathway chaperone